MRWLGFVLCGIGAACQVSPKFAGLDQGVRRVAFDDALTVTTLANGLRVAVVPDARTNLVTIDVRYEVGAADDPPGRAGMAHYAEHVMWEAGVRSRDGGTSPADATLFSSARTTHSSTQFSAIALDVDLARALEIEARRLEIPCITLDEALLVRERDVVLEEMAVRLAEAPAMDGLSAAVWGRRHPYGRGAGGTEFATAPTTELCAFVSGHYVPRAATLVVTGNVDEGVLDTIRARFERIPDRRPPLRNVLPPLPAPPSAPIAVVGLARPTALLVIPVPAAGGQTDALVEIAAGQVRERLHNAGLPAANAFVLGDHRARVIVGYLELDDGAELPRAGERMRKALDTRADYDIVDLQRDARTEFAIVHERLWDRGTRLAEQIAITPRPSQFRALQQIDRLSSEAVDRFVHDQPRVVIELVPAGVGEAPGSQSGRIASLVTELHRLDVARTPVDPLLATQDVALPTTRVARPLEDYQLANGLRVVLAPDPESIAIDARLVFSVGTDSDPRDQRGRALLAARALEPDDGWTEGEYESRLVRWYLTTVGNRPSITVAPRATTFRVTGLAAFADWHVWNVAWTVLHGVYSPALDHYDRFMRRSRRPQRAKRLVEPTRLLDRLLGGEIEMHDTSSAWVSRAHLEEFRRSAYQPRGATLIVSGKFDVAAIRVEIETLFAPWRAQAEPLPVAPARAHGRSTRGARHFAIIDPAAMATEVLIGFVPTTAASDDPRARAARAILSAMLDDRMRVVREGLGVSYGVHGALDARAILIRGDLHREHAPQAMAAIDSELTRLLAGGPDVAADFARARRLVLGRQLADPSGAIQRANELEDSVVRSGRLDDPDRLVAAIRTLSLHEVTAAATYLRPEQRIVILRGPRSSMEAAFEAIGVAAALVHWDAE